LKSTSEPDGSDFDPPKKVRNMDRATAEAIIVRAIREVFAQTGDTPPEQLPSETVLVGPGAVLDSLGVVSLIVEVEQIVEGEHSVSVILANDKAMSQKNSPFRTIGVLAEHLLQTIAEEQAA
jgi:acyl carrier protein